VDPRRDDIEFQNCLENKIFHKTETEFLNADNKKEQKNEHKIANGGCPQRRRPHHQVHEKFSQKLKYKNRIKNQKINRIFVYYQEFSALLHQHQH
jgi:hypothetical protein